MTYQKDRIFNPAECGQFPGEPLFLLDFGLEKRQEGFRTTTTSEQSCNRYLFIYTFRGKGVCQEGEVLYPLLPQTAFLSLLPLESTYYISEDKPEDDWEYLYVYFQGLSALPFYRMIHEAFGPILALSPDSIPIKIWTNLLDDFTRGRKLRSYEGGEVLYRFLSSLLRTLEADCLSCAPSQSYVEQSVSYMKKHLADNFSMETLAGTLGISPSYFTRLFVKEIGMTPLNYLNDLRLACAVSLLSTTLLTVEEVAKNCGFSCGNYFCKVFRKALGYSPSEYRQRYGQLAEEKSTESITSVGKMPAGSPPMDKSSLDRLHKNKSAKNRSSDSKMSGGKTAGDKPSGNSRKNGFYPSSPLPKAQSL